MKKDPIVEEVRQRRLEVEESARRSGKSLFDYICLRQKEHAGQLVTLHPQPALKRKTA